MPTLGELAALVHGRVQGDPSIQIQNAATVRWAQPGEITLVENERYLKQLVSSNASACVIPEDLAAHPCLDRPAIVVGQCLEAFERIVAHLRPLPRSEFTGISPHAWIHPDARLGPNVTVYPGAWLDTGVQVGSGTVIHSGCRILAGTRIGRDCVLFPNVVVYEGTRIGDRVVIHANAVIGAYGFGYALRDGAYCRCPQVGYVEIQDDVEIGAATTIDRGTFDATVIGQGTKIDNQVMIAHNCHIGRHNLLCSQVGIAGSCATGDYVIMAGQVGVRDHVQIGSGVRLGAQAGVASDIPDGACYFGSPARPEREERQILGSMAKIPEMRKQLKRLDRLVQQLLQHTGLQDEHSGEARSDAA